MQNKKKNTKEILAERQKTHGDFRTQAAIARCLKSSMHGWGNWHQLKAYQKEALDMIQHKIARILNGNADFKDHWDDIAGYATLVAREL